MNRTEIKKEVDEILYHLQLGEILDDVDFNASLMHFMRANRQYMNLTSNFAESRRFSKILKYRMKVEGKELGLGEHTQWWMR
jgi:hypothetical protein